MSANDDPRRLRDDPTAGEALRDALEAGRDERPSDAQLAALWAGLGPRLDPGGGDGGGGDGGQDGDVGGGGGGDAGSGDVGGGAGGSAFDPSGPTLAGTSAAAKGIAAVAIAAAVAAGAGWWVSRDEASPERTPAIVETPRERPTAPSALPRREDVPPGVDVPSDLDEPAALGATDPPRRVPPREPAAPAFEVDPAAEAALIRRAQATLARDPSAGLSLTEEHAARFGDGTLAQEREVVAIDALHRLGREADARRRADAFRSRWPRSAHARRLDVILND